MSNLKTCAASAIISSIFVLGAPGEASAAISAWVSGAGQDVSGCGAQTTPCRSFQYVHDNVLGPSGGDILVRDSGSFGPLSITKPVSVINDGVGTAGTGAPSGQIAISINTTGNVLLKGLTIDGVSGAYGGVNVAAAGSVTITNCLVQNFSHYGIQIYTNLGVTRFSILDTLVQNNGVDGIYVNTYAGTLQGAIGNARILNNGTGIEATGGTTQFTVADSLISGNASGLHISGYSTLVALRHSSITWNTVGYYTTQAVTQTYGDNMIMGNGGNTGTLQTVGSN
jgi:hypothetical protein